MFTQRCPASWKEASYLLSFSVFLLRRLKSWGARGICMVSSAHVWSSCWNHHHKKVAQQTCLYATRFLWLTCFSFSFLSLLVTKRPVSLSWPQAEPWSDTLVQRWSTVLVVVIIPKVFAGSRDWFWGHLRVLHTANLDSMASWFTHNLYWMTFEF